jgi:hypothetical protein
MGLMSWLRRLLRGELGGGGNGENLGQQTIEWLYNEQLKVDPEWSVWTENGFQWWPDKNAQTIEVIGEETGPDGEAGYLISVRTEFLKDLDLSDQSLYWINDFLMSLAAMAGPVYDAESRTLSLCSLVMIHQEISVWMKPLISVSAAIQIHEARVLGAEMAASLDAKEHISGHPQNGMRPAPDEMAFVVENLIAPLGQKDCKWPESEFKSVVQKYMQKPPAYRAKSDGTELTVEFPYGDGWSICAVREWWHMRYGNGLSLFHSFPIEGVSEAEGIRLALSLNETEMTKKPAAYGFGSYSYEDESINYMCFLPNLVYKPGFLPNLYFVSALRAYEMACLHTGRGWT